jgi:hypothetical protein
MPLPDSADPGTIVLGPPSGHIAFKLAQAKGNDAADLITVSQLSAYQPGVTIGSPNVDSHPVLSTWGIADLTGGHGVADHQAGVTDNRYRYGTADVTRKAWTPRLDTNAETGTAGAFMPGGDLLVSGAVEMYGTFGTDLHIWDETNDEWDDTGNNLTAAPPNTGVAFAGTGTLKLFMPMGASGYATYTGAVFANVAASGSVPAAKCFCIYGNTMLICLSTTGQLWYSVDGTTWTSFGADGKVDGSLTANWLYEDRDVMGNPVLQVVTTGGLYSFDPAGPTLYKLDLQFPNHPSQGRAACNWQGQQYIAAGMNIFSFTGSNIGSIGLDRDEGLPAAQGLRGSIVSLVPELNGMYALVQGDAQDAVVVDILVDSSVQVWTGYGWHAVWESTTNDPVDVTKLYVSGARSQHRLWWGTYNGSTYSSQTIVLPIGQLNSRQLLTWSGSFDFAGTAYIETGLTNMGMPGSTKIAVSVGLRASGNDGVDIAFPVVKYRTVDLGSWTTCVGPKDATGATISGFMATETTYFYWIDSAFVGARFDEIELRVDWASPSYIEWVALYFTKLISGNRAWTVTLDLTEKFEDNSPEVMDAALDAFILTDNIIDFIYRDTTYKVRVTSWSGADSSGRADTRGMRSVQLLEVHDRP